jgi:hypothetical protein
MSESTNAKRKLDGAFQAMIENLFTANRELAIKQKEERVRIPKVLSPLVEQVRELLYANTITPADIQQLFGRLHFVSEIMQLKKESEI